MASEAPRGADSGADSALRRRYAQQLEKGFQEMSDALAAVGDGSAFRAGNENIALRVAEQFGWELTRDCLGTHRKGLGTGSAERVEEAAEKGLRRLLHLRRVVPGEALHRFMVCAELPGTVEDVLKFATSIDHIAEFDPLYAGGEVLERVPALSAEELAEREGDGGGGGEALEVAHAKFSLGIPLVSPRDFVWLEAIRATETEDKGRVHTVQVFSVEDERAPPEKGFVRAKILSSGYVLWPSAENPGHTNTLYMVQVDPCGWIPKWVVNMVGTEDKHTFQLADAILAAAGARDGAGGAEKEEDKGEDDEGKEQDRSQEQPQADSGEV